MMLQIPSQVREGHCLLLLGVVAKAAARRTPNPSAGAAGPPLELSWAEAAPGAELQSLSGLPGMLTTPPLLRCVPFEALAAVPPASAELPPQLAQPSAAGSEAAAGHPGQGHRQAASCWPAQQYAAAAATTAASRPSGGLACSSQQAQGQVHGSGDARMLDCDGAAAGGGRDQGQGRQSRCCCGGTGAAAGDLLGACSGGPCSRSLAGPSAACEPLACIVEVVDARVLTQRAHRCVAWVDWRAGCRAGDQAASRAAARRRHRAGGVPPHTCLCRASGSFVSHLQPPACRGLRLRRTSPPRHLARPSVAWLNPSRLLQASAGNAHRPSCASRIRTASSPPRPTLPQPHPPSRPAVAIQHACAPSRPPSAGHAGCAAGRWFAP